MKDIRGLHLLCDIGQTGSLTRSADALEVSQPTASKLIQKLEHEVGGELVYRKRRPIQLTTLGKSIAQQAGPLLEGLNQLFPNASKDELKQTVVVACSHEMLAFVLVDTLGRFHRKYPDIRVAAREGYSGYRYENLIQGDAHLVVGPKPPDKLNLKYHHLGVVRRVLITELNHPLTQQSHVTFRDFANWPIIQSGSGGPSPTIEAILSGVRSEGLECQVAFEVDSIDSMKRFVAMGLGISAAPAFAIGPEDSTRLAVMPAPVLAPFLDVGVITLPGKSLPPQARWLQEMIIEDVPPLLV